MNVPFYKDVTKKSLQQKTSAQSIHKTKGRKLFEWKLENSQPLHWLRNEFENTKRTQSVEGCAIV